MSYASNNDFIITLEQNAFDSLQHGAEHFFDNSRETDLKYAVLHLSHAIELLLKARLAKEGLEQIYLSKEQPIDLEGFTVGYDEAVKRLKRFQIGFDTDQLKNLGFLKKVRNSIEHNYISGQREVIQDYVAEAFKFVRDFSLKHLDITLKEKLDLSIYESLNSNLYSYEERIIKAGEEISHFREKEFPTKGLRAKDLMEYDSIHQDTECPTCGEATVPVPDPKSEDESVRCYHCDERFYVQFCIECNLPTLYTEPESEDTYFPFCEDCMDAKFGGD
jgi:hypothetical protein